MRNYIARLFEQWSDKIRKAIYLDQYDFINRGWKRTETKGSWITFTKGKYALKFDSKRYIVSLKYNKAPRFYGPIRFAHKFDEMITLNNLTYKK